MASIDFYIQLIVHSPCNLGRAIISAVIRSVAVSHRVIKYVKWKPSLLIVCAIGTQPSKHCTWAFTASYGVNA